jgi:Uma2 family endonuclease
LPPLRAEEHARDTLHAMHAARRFDDSEHDQRVLLRGMSWQVYETLLEHRGKAAGLRMYYLDGEIELLTTSREHELRKKTLGRLVETWAMETEEDLNGFGSWTLKRQLREAGAEPDECYILGPPETKDVPDLVIEIEWSRVLGLPKEEIYRRLGVRELWTLPASGPLRIRVLEKGRWVARAKSRVLPALDIPWLTGFLDIEPQSKAVRALSQAIRKRR